MGDLAEVYDGVRGEISNLVAGLSEDDVTRPVPATPGWTIRGILAHLAGDAACVIVGDFPNEFFAAMGDEAAIADLNEWTAGHVSKRAGMSVHEICDEWEISSKTVTDMMRDPTSWPDNVPPFGDRVLVTDLGVHQHDIHGALGIVSDRDSAPVRVGSAGYVAVMDLRLRTAGAPALRIEAGDKSWVIGGDEPVATLRTDRFELFRAMSGRRSPDQIRAYEWDGDPEPFIPFFYLYGLRTDALVE
jgi:uncharacterized protein (TIGR03083 family)